MYVCMNAWMHVRTYVRMYVCWYGVVWYGMVSYSMVWYGCMYVCMHACDAM